MKNKVLLIIAAVYCIIGVIVFAITKNVGASALIWLMAVNKNCKKIFFLFNLFRLNKPFFSSYYRRVLRSSPEGGNYGSLCKR